MVTTCNCRHEEARALACSGIAAVIANDSGGSATLEVVRALGAIAKRRMAALHPAAIELLRTVPLSFVAGREKKRGLKRGSVEGTCSVRLSASGR